jgi:hypothetical protein
MRMDAARRVGVFFWGMTAACAVLSAYGLMTTHPGFIMAGMMGTAWFLMLACMPRQWFLKWSELEKPSQEK